TEQLAVPRVAIPGGIHGPVLLPQQHARHPLTAQLPIHPIPIRCRPLHRRPSRCREQQPLQSRVINLRQRPRQASLLSPALVLPDRAATNPAAASNLPAATTLGPQQPQGLPDLPHRQPLPRHPASNEGTVCPSTPAPTPTGGGMAGKPRNQWPERLATGGRI